MNITNNSWGISLTINLFDIKKDKDKLKINSFWFKGDSNKIMLQ